MLFYVSGVKLGLTIKGNMGWQSSRIGWWQMYMCVYVGENNSRLEQDGQCTCK